MVVPLLLLPLVLPRQLKVFIWAMLLSSQSHGQMPPRADGASGGGGVPNPFRPGSAMRILGALQRPWELRPFYATSIGAGSFVPLASPFSGDAMALQHPAAPGGTDGSHPAADDGKPGSFPPILLAVWDLSKSTNREAHAKKVPLALLSGGVSVHEIGTRCTALHGPDCPALKRAARSREMAVMLAAVVEEPSMQWWTSGYSLDRSVQVLLSKLPAWRREYGADLKESQEPVATVASTLRARAGGSTATTNAAIAAQAAEERTKQALERVAAAQAAGAKMPEFVSIGRGYCRAPNDGKTHYTYRCFPQCRGQDQIDLKKCEALCTENCTAISHRQSDGRCVLYYGGLFRTFMNVVGWQHQKGTSGNEDPGEIVAASASQGVDHACLMRVSPPPKIPLSASAVQAATLRQEATERHAAHVRAKEADYEAASNPVQAQQSAKRTINQLNPPPSEGAEQQQQQAAAGAEAADRKTWEKAINAIVSRSTKDVAAHPLSGALRVLAHEDPDRDQEVCSAAYMAAFASTLPGGACAPEAASRGSSSVACPAACQEQLTSVKEKCDGFVSTMADGKPVVFLCPAMQVLGNATAHAQCDVRPLPPSERANYCDA